MKKTITYLSLVLSFLFMLNSGKSTAQCAANFNYSLNANGNVTFTANCTPANSVTTQYYWSYGNSTTYSTTGSTTASVTYTANGTYTVNLFFITMPTCSNSITYTINVSNITTSCNINANFSWTAGTNGLINFTSISTGTVPGTNYTWDFADASPTGNGSFVSHTYSTNGTYSVVLYANNNFTSTCTDSIILPVFVTNICGLNASYSYTQGTNGQVSFLSTSTGTTPSTNYFWNFGDATTSFGNSVSHTYTNNGTYIATLTAVGSPSTCWSSASNTIIVNSNSLTPCNLIAGYTHTVGSGGNVAFANASSGTNANSTYYWNFGDGFTSTSQNPTHTYSSAGAYNVLLFVNNQTNPTCIDTVMQSVNVTGISCIANAGFSLSPVSATVGLNWNATPSFPWNVVAATWSWGDNSTSNTLYTSHTYSASGTYSICLSVTVSCGATASTCVNQFIFKTSGPNMQMIQVNVVPPALTPTSIKNAEIENIDWSVYPNPSNGQFELKMNGAENETVKIKVYNLIGQIVYETETTNDDTIKKINMNDASNGIYFIKINANNNEYTKKIIVSK